MGNNYWVGNNIQSKLVTFLFLIITASFLVPLPGKVRKKTDNIYMVEEKTGFPILECSCKYNSETVALFQKILD